MNNVDKVIVKSDGIKMVDDKTFAKFWRFENQQETFLTSIDETEAQYIKSISKEQLKEIMFNHKGVVRFTDNGFEQTISLI